MVETISDLLGGVCGILLAGEIVSVVGEKLGIKHTLKVFSPSV